jgi:FMN phosphatase YigB (HAD superfamily)
MSRTVFAPFFDHLAANLRPYYEKETVDVILDDLWRYTWLEVMDKHKIAETLMRDAIRVLDRLELDLQIAPYPDYSHIQKMDCPKFLVTTSLTSLQQKKIRALGIERDFTKIVINDTFIAKRTKQDVFEDLVREYRLIPERTYVIGDNAHSEISAGNALNMITVQILRQNVVKGDNARHYISSFHELDKIFT